MNRIESYYIYFEPDIILLSRFALYQKLYSRVLKKDDKWHYFTEGEYDELRFSSKYKRKVENVLNEEIGNWVVKNYIRREDGWKDSHEIVETYKDYFTAIFHQNTLLSLQLGGDRIGIDQLHLQKIVDRVIHSFFNMIHLFKEDSNLEVKVLKDYLVNRAFYTGRLYQYEIMKGENK